MKKARQQGNLDALCGMYAVTNAFLASGVKVKNEARLFKKCCQSIDREHWPNTLWQGTTFKEIRMMIRTCAEEVKGASRVRIDYPFRGGMKPKSDREFHERCLKLLDDENVSCVLIGLKKRERWVVAKKVGGRLVHFDSSIPHPAARNRPALEAELKEQYCMKQLAVFYRSETKICP